MYLVQPDNRMRAFYSTINVSSFLCAGESMGRGPNCTIERVNSRAPESGEMLLRRVLGDIAV